MILDSYSPYLKMTLSIFSLSHNSHTSATPYTFTASRIPAGQIRTLHRECLFFFSDSLQCDSDCCTFYYLTCTASKNRLSPCLLLSSKTLYKQRKTSHAVFKNGGRLCDNALMQTYGLRENWSSNLSCANSTPDTTQQT